MLKIVRLIIDLLIKAIPQPPVTTVQINSTKIVAHRGCHDTGLIENTLPAFVLCLEQNIWGIEFDIRFTCDNIPVVHHDPHCGRVFQHHQLIISQINFTQLRAKVPDIPTLAEVIQKCGKAIHFMIEIKSVLSAEQNEILKNVLTPLESKEDYHMLSLKKKYLDSIRFVDHDCYLPVAELNVHELVRYAVKKKCAGIAGHYLLINQSLKRELSRLGLQTGVGYAESRNSLIREIHNNHTWIFTNHITRVKKWTDEMKVL